ncbi:MAG: nucleotide exchange factor GrpE [Anaerolineae bacterium]
MSEEQKPEDADIASHKPCDESQIKHLEEEVKEYKDKYLRLLAEGDNTRKRLQKEKQEMTRFAIENVLAEILLPIDNLENALKFGVQMSEETRNWAKGFQMILNQFKDVLHNNGVSAFQSVGSQFDPYKHEAVEMEETDAYPEGTVIEEFMKGYQSGDRILRAARVKVAKAPSQQSMISEEKE